MGTAWADGSEDRVHTILRAARDCSSTSDELAARIRDWPTRYHFSRLRSKILNPLRIAPGTRVLDLGGGTGPITRKLGELGAEVLLLDGSADRAEAAAERCRDLDNVSVAVGTVFDLDGAERFDVVLTVGVLEYTQSGPGGTAGFLRHAASLLSSEGVLAVAIENSIGLKYLLGYAEDHLGLPWVGWEGYPGVEDVRTFSRRELGALLTSAGLPEHAWFSPFPDYKLPTVIVSDAGYDQAGPDVLDSIVPQPCSADASLPLLLCDARAAHRTMLDAGLGRDVANSFLVISGRTTAALDAHVDRETLAWLSGSERRALFMRDRRLVSTESGLAIVDDSLPDDEVKDGWLIHRRFPEVAYAEGVPLDRLVSEALAAANAERTSELLELWTQTLKAHALPAEEAHEEDGHPASPFQATAGRLALPGYHLDSQPSNFVYREGRLERIDGEWQARGMLDFDLVCLRGLFHFAGDALARGISASRLDGRDLASVVRGLMRAAGLDGYSEALLRLPTAEGSFQAVVRGLPVQRVQAEIERLLSSPARELMTRVDESPAHASIAALEAELEALRGAHEAQARHVVRERLALAQQIEQELTVLRGENATLREEIEWRKGVIEHREEQIAMLENSRAMLENSRSVRYTRPLRQLASLLRRH